MSETIEETTQDSLAHGFTYFMDERDKEWLDKNNEELVMKEYPLKVLFQHPAQQ